MVCFVHLDYTWILRKLRLRTLNTYEKGKCLCLVYMSNQSQVSSDASREHISKMHPVQRMRVSAPGQKAPTQNQDLRHRKKLKTKRIVPPKRLNPKTDTPAPVADVERSQATKCSSPASDPDAESADVSAKIEQRAWYERSEGGVLTPSSLARKRCGTYEIGVRKPTMPVEASFVLKKAPPEQVYQSMHAFISPCPSVFRSVV